MKEAIKIFTEGELMAISTGEYSDYCINGLFKVLISFDAQEKLEEWAKETGRALVDGEVKSDYMNKEIEYMAWLSKNEYVENVEYRELHTEDYGDINLSEY